MARRHPLTLRTVQARRRRALVLYTDPAAAQKAAKRMQAAKRRRAERLAEFSIDEFGQIRRGSVERAGEVLTIRLPFRTFSQSAGSGNNWGGSWHGKAAEVRAWLARLEHAVDASTSIVNRAAWRDRAITSLAARLEWHAPAGLALVTVRRIVSRRSWLIKDDDNLRFSAKGLIDAVVATGFLRGDSFAEITRRYTQRVEAAGLDWTEIEIDARPGAAERAQ